MLKINTQSILFYLVYPFILFISILPLPVLYFISDWFLYPVAYDLFGYRKKVVRTNISKSFPEKTESERKAIEKGFYHYLCDLILETIKGITISKSELQKKYEFVFDRNLTDKWYKEERNFLVTMGHYGNYEWFGMLLCLEFKHLCTGPYHELKNPFFDKMFKEMRSKFGTYTYPTYKTYRILKKGFNRNFQITLGNDQSAPPTQSYWTTFLNQDTSFFNGTEKIARKFDMPVLFGQIKRIKRGKYEANFKLITENPNEEPVGYILEKHAKMLEQQIIEHPEFWLWSHKRWKHKKPNLSQVKFIG
jgi:KDO2-lipid IV(A) lauroyltransferase